MAAKHKAVIETSHGKRTCFEARKERKGKQDLTARFGGIPLRRDWKALIRDPKPARAIPHPKEVSRRIRKHWCELCEQAAKVEVHQVVRLADLVTKGSGQSAWDALMMKKRRKTLIVCAACHKHIHARPAALAA
jgi:hypothetical protein